MDHLELNEELGCTVFVDSDIAKENLVKLIEDFLDGKKRFSDTIVDNMYVYVKHNDDRDESMKNHPTDGFLYYEYRLEINPLATTNFQTYVQQLRHLINFLRNKGFKVIPSCTFEDELNDGKNYKEFMK